MFNSVIHDFGVTEERARNARYTPQTMARIIAETQDHTILVGLALGAGPALYHRIVTAETSVIIRAANLSLGGRGSACSAHRPDIPYPSHHQGG